MADKPVADEVQTHASVLPQPDAAAYDGDIIVKTKTYGKSRTVKASGSIGPGLICAREGLFFVVP